MTAGLEVYGPDGSFRAGVTTRLGRLTGQVVTTANVAGSVNIPGSGTPFYIARDATPNGMFTNTSYPSITLSGITLSWSAAQRPLTLIYGVY